VRTFAVAAAAHGVAAVWQRRGRGCGELGHIAAANSGTSKGVRERPMTVTLRPEALRLRGQLPSRMRLADKTRCDSMNAEPP
jgi:hypothetical protein